MIIRAVASILISGLFSCFVSAGSFSQYPDTKFIDGRLMVAVVSVISAVSNTMKNRQASDSFFLSYSKEVPNPKQDTKSTGSLGAASSVLSVQSSQSTGSRSGSPFREIYLEDTKFNMLLEHLGNVLTDNEQYNFLIVTGVDDILREKVLPVDDVDIASNTGSIDRRRKKKLIEKQWLQKMNSLLQKHPNIFLVYNMGSSHNTGEYDFQNDSDQFNKLPLADAIISNAGAKITKGPEGMDNQVDVINDYLSHWVKADNGAPLEMIFCWQGITYNEKPFFVYDNIHLENMTVSKYESAFDSFVNFINNKLIYRYSVNPAQVRRHRDYWVADAILRRQCGRPIENEPITDSGEEQCFDCIRGVREPKNAFKKEQIVKVIHGFKKNDSSFKTNVDKEPEKPYDCNELLHVILTPFEERTDEDLLLSSEKRARMETATLVENSAEAPQNSWTPPRGMPSDSSLIQDLLTSLGITAQDELQDLPTDSVQSLSLNDEAVVENSQNKQSASPKKKQLKKILFSNTRVNKGVALRVLINLMQKSDSFGGKPTFLIVIGSDIIDMPMIRYDEKANALTPLTDEQKKRADDSINLLINPHYEMSSPVTWVKSIVFNKLNLQDLSNPHVSAMLNDKKVVHVNAEPGLLGFLETIVTTLKPNKIKYWDGFSKSAGNPVFRRLSRTE